MELYIWELNNSKFKYIPTCTISRMKEAVVLRYKQGYHPIIYIRFLPLFIQVCCAFNLNRKRSFGC